VWTAYGQVKERLGQIQQPDDEEHAAAWDRLHLMCELLERHRKGGDGRRFTPAMLDVPSQQLDGMVSYLDQVVADPAVNGAALVTAAELADEVYTEMGAWPSLSEFDEMSAVVAAANAFIGAAAERQRDLEQRAEAAEASLQEAADRVDKAVEAAGDHGKAAVNEQLKSLSADIWNSTDAIVKSAEASRDQAAAALEEVQAHRVESGRIAAALARFAVAQDFARNARNKAIGGWIWDLLGVLVGAAGLYMLFEFLDDTEGDSNFTIAATRLGISATALGLAALCFRRGATNHQEARMSKRADLRVSTVRGFVANLDDDVQDSIREGMAERIYMLGDLGESSAHTSTGRSFQEILAAVRHRRGGTEADPPE
jgi:hypothetical protein